MKLTATQQAALDVARTQGFVGPTDVPGIRLQSVRRLEALGLVKVRAEIRTWTSSHKMTRQRCDWVAFPIRPDDYS